MGNEQNNNQAPEQDINQLLKVRREKLSALQEAGKDPFQITKYNQTHHTDEVKSLYEEHEAKLLVGRVKPSVDGLDEAAAREVLNNDYNERRAIMDASPINVTIAGRMMFKRVMGKASFCNIQDLRVTFRYMLLATLSVRILTQTLRSPISVTSTVLQVLLSEPRPVRFLFMQIP